MSDVEHKYVAKYGNTVLKGNSFTDVCDVLQERGFIMEDAVVMSHPSNGGDRNIIKIPHSNPSRKPAKLEYLNGHTVEIETTTVSVEIASAELTYTSVITGTTQPTGLATRECGAVHPEGVACFIPILYEPLSCSCGDRTYQHEGPHEAVTPEGVKFRWEEVLIIRDLPFNTYGPMSEEEMEAFKEGDGA